MTPTFKSVYVAFDPHPSSKGASTHMDQMCRVLGEDIGPTLLLTLTGTSESVDSPTVTQLTFHSEETNLLRKASAFSAWVNEILSSQYDLVLGHFRDIWGGMAVINHEHICPVFEVNAFPSIELPYRYPMLSETTLNKIRRMEDTCLQKANHIITPSHTNSRYIQSRGIARENISVITNGADLPVMSETRDPSLPETYMVYFGALQPWQGIDVLLKSLRYLEDKQELKLVICSSHAPRYSRPYEKFLEKTGLEDRVIWKYQLPRHELDAIIQHALLTVAPLTECDRNLQQGCSPLKIFESMACGTPVIASDLPVVREIIEPDVTGKLFRVGRPSDLSRCIRILIDFPEYRLSVGQAARRKIQTSYSWSQKRSELSGVYQRMLTFSTP